MPNEIVYHLKMWNDQLYLTSRSGVFHLTDTFHRVIPETAVFEDFDIDEEGTLY